MQNNPKTKNVSVTLKVILFSVFLAATGIFVDAQDSHGATLEGDCMVVRFNETKPASVSDLNCTSNDVQLAIYEVVSGPETCIDGDIVDVRLKGDFIATSRERWDVGVFIAQDGGTPNALGGVCYSDYLHPVSANNNDLDLFCTHTGDACSIDTDCTGGSFCGDHTTPCTTDADCTGTVEGTCLPNSCNTLSEGFGPYYNGEITEDPTDTCGDIQQNVRNAFITEEFSIVCQDTDNDGNADVTSCTVWANSRSDGSTNKPSCSYEADITAETTAKCTCDVVNIIGIEIEQEAQIEVVKDLIPSSDAGLFNLQIEGVNKATDVGDDGTTGPVTVGAGTNLNPGADYDVGETAGTETSLDSYVTSISCVDRGLSTFDGDVPLTLSGAGPLNVPVDPDDDIVCTITNTNGCVTTDCNQFDTVCADFECDPTGAVDNCDDVTYFPGTLCRPGSGDICDPAETCVDQSAACPADVVAPATTVCNPGSGDICDPAESCTGAPGAACPADIIAPATTICRPGSGDLCDPGESCTGVADAACPADIVAPATTICRTGSGDGCDPDESCTGVADEACPADLVAPATTICNPGSGDICDPDESCTGTPGAACPDDTIAPATTVCNPGSGDICDPDESCTGVADAACPDDVVTPATTVCNPGSGDICDPDESCTGVADAACPEDRVAPATTVCNPGSGDICDPDESCTGVAGEACAPTDTIAPATTICRTGSGDLCDPDESCTGVEGEACPADVVAPATTVCNPGSGDLCDPDESCTGVEGQACPADVVAPATTICRPGSGDLCDPDESCTGVADASCPDDLVEPATTICNPGSGDICDPDESCTGIAGEACALTDTIAPATTVCRPGSGDICDPDESCTGIANEACPDDVVQPATTICRQGTDGVCDPDESCTGIAGEVCPDDVILPCEECLTHTGGYWGTHPWATIQFLPVTSCGLEVNNVNAYPTGEPAEPNGGEIPENTTAQGSAIEDICFGGKRDTKAVGYSPQQTQLIRQCTVAAINMSATAYYEGSCDGYLIPENECIPVDVPCTGGECADGSGTCTVDADCAYSYCSQGGADSCDTNEDCPDNPFTLWIIPDVMAWCCDTPEGGPEALCTSSASGSVISSSGCIEALDMFNNSEDTFDINPDLCEFSPDENCSADNDACKDSSNNGWMNCRGDLGDNPSCGECGDGYVRGTEECDDGNTDNFDECSNDCVLNSP